MLYPHSGAAAVALVAASLVAGAWLASASAIQSGSWDATWAIFRIEGAGPDVDVKTAVQYDAPAGTERIYSVQLVLDAAFEVQSASVYVHRFVAPGSLQTAVRVEDAASIESSVSRADSQGFAGADVRIGSVPAEVGFVAVLTSSPKAVVSAWIDPTSLAVLANVTSGSDVRLIDFVHGSTLSVTANDPVVILGGERFINTQESLIGTLWADSSGIVGSHAAATTWNGPAGRGSSCSELDFIVGSCSHWHPLAGPNGSYDLRVDRYIGYESGWGTWVMFADAPVPGPSS